MGNAFSDEGGDRPRAPAHSQDGSSTPPLGVPPVDTGRARHTLVVDRGPATGARQPLAEGAVLTLGRRYPGFGSLAGDDALSSEHARIWSQDARVIVEDLNSTNGTWINGTRITAPAELRVGDRLVVGRSECVLVGAGDRPGPPAATEVAEAGYAQPAGMGDAEKAVRSYIRFRVLLGVGMLSVMLLGVGAFLAYDALRDKTVTVKTVTVPDVVGMDNVNAASTLYPLEPMMFREPSTEVQFGYVIRTDPQAGTRVDEGSTVSVYLSCGEPRPGFCESH